jgi:hypothetical protein
MVDGTGTSKYMNDRTTGLMEKDVYIWTRGFAAQSSFGWEKSLKRLGMLVNV